jgi:hypothetical protein
MYQVDPVSPHPKKPKKKTARRKHRSVGRLENPRKKKASLLTWWVETPCRHPDPTVRRIAHCSNLALIQERIHYGRWELYENARSLLEMHLKLAAELTQNYWDVVDCATTPRSEVTLMKSSTGHGTRGRSVYIHTCISLLSQLSFIAKTSIAEYTH